MDTIINKIPYPIEFDVDFDINAVVKAYKVRFEDSEDAFLPRLISYCKLIHRVCSIELLVFANIKQYLTADELTAFYEELKYEHLYILDIEGAFSYKLETESCIIIDRDKCLIKLDWHLVRNKG